MELSMQIILLALCIALSGFFAAAEISLVSLTEARVRTMVAKKRFGSTSIRQLKDSPQRMLSAVLIANNLVNIAAASLMTVVMINLFGDYGIGIATGVTTFLVLVFGDLVPKSIAAQHNEPIAQATAPTVWLVTILFAPIIVALDWFLTHVIAMLGIKQKSVTITEDEIKSLISIARKEGSINELERRLIEKVFAFDEKVVGDIITPRTDLIMIPNKATVGEALRIMIREHHSRLPVFDGQNDNIVGILYVRDLLGKPKKTKVKGYIRPAYVVPDTKRIGDLLQRLQRRKEHMAIVVEEHGLVIGIVTLEDILEEIVGDIADETETKESPIKEDDNAWIVEGSLAIADANERLQLHIPEGEYTTVGGFLFDKHGHIPKQGERLTHGDFVYVAEDISRNRVKKVRITRK